MTELMHHQPSLQEQILAGIGQLSQRLETLEARVLQVSTTSNRALGLLDADQTALLDRQVRHETVLTDARLEIRAQAEYNKRALILGY